MDTKRIKREYYHKMMVIGIPVVIQNLISMGLNLIDTLMIGKVGENEIAAVGAANQLYFIFTVALFGLYSGAAVFTSQFWGQQDLGGVKRTLGIDYVVAVIITGIFTCLGLLVPGRIIALFTKDPMVIEIGISYLRIACFSYIFSAFSFALSFNSRAIQRLTYPTIINALALIVNAVLNYILIFGKAGAPTLGVRGAAIATLVARGFEFVAIVIYVYVSKDHPLRGTARELFSFGGDMFKKVLKTAVPVLLSESSWSISVALIFAAYGRIGTSALAVAQIANVVSELLQSVFFGIGNATMVVIGEKLGRRENDAAYYLGVLAIKVVTILSVIMAMIFALLASPIASIYDFAPSTMALLVAVLRVQALLIIGKMVGYIFVIGIFRAGGDTMFTFVLDTITNLFIQVPLAFFAVLVLKTGLPVAMLLVSIGGEVIRIAVCIPRFRSKKWLNTVT